MTIYTLKLDIGGSNESGGRYMPGKKLGNGGRYLPYRELEKLIREKAIHLNPEEEIEKGLDDEPWIMIPPEY